MILSMNQFLGLRRSGGLERFHRKLASGKIFGITKPCLPNPERALFKKHGLKGKHKKMARRAHHKMFARANDALESTTENRQEDGK